MMDSSHVSSDSGPSKALFDLHRARLGEHMSTTFANIANLILMSGLLVTSCGDRPIEPEQAATIRILGGDERLPASATGIWVREDGFQGSTQHIRFDGPVDDTRQFAENLLHKKLHQGEDADALKCCEQLDWWIKSAPPETYTADSVIDGRSFTAAMVINGNRARLWVQVAEMT